MRYTLRLSLAPSFLKSIRWKCCTYRIYESRMSVHRNRALASIPKRNNYVNRIREKDVKGIGKNLQEDFISWVGRILKPFWSVDGVGVDCFYPHVESCGSCRIPSPPPDPTESCHFYPSALKHFAAITGVMRNLPCLFNHVRHSLDVFVFLRRSSTAILRVSRIRCAPRFHMRSNPDVYRNVNQGVHRNVSL